MPEGEYLLVVHPAVGPHLEEWLEASGLELVQAGDVNGTPTYLMSTNRNWFIAAFGALVHERARLVKYPWLRQDDNGPVYGEIGPSP